MCQAAARRLGVWEETEGGCALSGCVCFCVCKRERENVHMAARRLGRSAYPTVAGRAGGATVTGVRPVLVIGLVAEGDAARVFGAQRIARGLGVAVCCGNDAIRTGAFHIRRVRRVS